MRRSVNYSVNVCKSNSKIARLKVNVYHRTLARREGKMEKPPIELVVQALETFSRHGDPAEQQKASKWLEQQQCSVRRPRLCRARELLF